MELNNKLQVRISLAIVDASRSRCGWNPVLVTVDVSRSRRGVGGILYLYTAWVRKLHYWHAWVISIIHNMCRDTQTPLLEGILRVLSLSVHSIADFYIPAQRVSIWSQLCGNFLQAVMKYSPPQHLMSSSLLLQLYKLMV